LGKSFAVRWPDTGRLLREDELQFSRALRGETVIEEVLATNRETGQEVHIRSACAPLIEEGTIIGAVAVNSDITARKRAAEALHQSEERLRLAMETAALGLYDRDLVNNEVRVDENCRRIMGLPEGQPDPDVARRSLHPDDRLRVLALVERSFDPNLQEICAADFRIIWPNGVVRWLAGRGRVVFDRGAPPKPLKFVGVLQDITERKQMEQALAASRAELERLVFERTAKLRDAMSELEHMSCSIVHDLRAPLRAIQGFAGLIAEGEQQRLSDESRDLLSRMEAATRRMDLLITDALNYNKAVREELPLARVWPGDVLRSIVKSHPEFQPPKAKITLDGAFPPILGNEAGLAQCFSNLIGNAVKFVRPGTVPQVRIWAEPRTDEKSRENAVRIWVEDNGTGIPKGGEGKIFQMFQRMHGSDYEGTGIGLALVRKVTERMGGRVGVESRENAGSRFWIEFAPAFAED
ncbi:MAG: sensor histidine kinase, partial [Limisphaerales bacterium]